MLIINAMTETATKGQKPDAAYLWSIAQTYKLDFPQAVDENKDLYNYSPTYPSVGLPFHVGVDLRTMKIYEAVRGTMTLSTMESKAKTALGN